MLRESYVHFSDISPGMVGLEDCESLLTHLKNKKTITEKFPVRHFLAIQQVVETQELDNAYWLP